VSVGPTRLPQARLLVQAQLPLLAQEPFWLLAHPLVQVRPQVLGEPLCLVSVLQQALALLQVSGAAS